METSTTSTNHLCSVSSLFLVSCLGLDGVDALRMAQCLVPDSFCNLRSSYITRVVNHVVKNNIVNEKSYKRIQNIALGVRYFRREATSNGFTEELKELTALTGKAHTAFVAPPVSRCIHQDCKLYNIEG